MLLYIEFDLRADALELFAEYGIGQLENLLDKYARLDEFRPE
jgi:hypothetical protein